MTEFFEDSIKLSNTSMNSSQINPSMTTPTNEERSQHEKKLNHLISSLEKIKITKELLKQIEEEYNNKTNKSSYL